MTEIIINIIEQPKPIKFTNKEENITLNYNFVIDLLNNDAVKINKKHIEFIGYLNQENSYQLIKVETPDIHIKKAKKLEFLIKLFQREKIDPSIEEIINKSNNIGSSIDMEISELKQQNFDMCKNSSNNLSLNLNESSSNNLSLESLNNSNNKKNKNKNVNKNNANIDIFVLTSNPLYSKKENVELRSINDFVFITNSVCQVVSNSKLYITSQFLTLTENNLIYAITKKPKILHLICKSTYQKISPYSVELLFEKEDLDVACITQSILAKKLSLYADDIKDITLFISTPLAQDVFNMFTVDQKFNFKDIIIQPTTVANIKYIAEFNRKLYINLLEKQPLYVAFKNAKCIKVENYQFCCCYHTHDLSCTFRKNLWNEIFKKNEEEDEILNSIQLGENKEKKNNKESKDKHNSDLNILLPHFYHLRYKCNCSNKYSNGIYNFCYHEKNKCYNNIYNNAYKKENNLCCCKKLIKNLKHNLDDFFQIQIRSSGHKNAIFEENIYDEYNKPVIIYRDLIANYEKMKFLVGWNKIFFNIFEIVALKSEAKEKIYNFYGKQYDPTEIDNIISILKEFMKERVSYLKDNDNYKKDFKDELFNQDLSLIKNDIDTEPKINKLSAKNNNKNKDILKFSKLSSSTNVYTQKSATQLHFYFNSTPSYKVLSQENYDLDINSNQIYIINALKFTNWKKFIDSNNDFSKAIIIIFNLTKIKNENFVYFKEEQIRDTPLNSLDDNDNKVENQIHKIEKNSKEDYELLFKKKQQNLEKEELEKISDFVYDKKNSLKFFEILYLFNCVNSGLFLFEFENLFVSDKEAEKIRDLYVEKKILKEEREQTAKKQPYTKYIKNKNVFNKIYISNNISYEAKQIILDKLFLFYAQKFRALIKKIKKERALHVLQNIVVNEKGYKPNEYLFSFSAIQSLGIWLPLNNPKKFEDNYEYTLYNLYGYFEHLNRNFNDIFLEENIQICYKNKAIWENVRDSFEDISITLLTLHKAFNTKSISNMISKMLLFFESNKYNFSLLSILRLKLFDRMHRIYDKDNKDAKSEFIKELENYRTAFRDIKNYEGELETLFAKMVVNKEEGWKVLRNIYENEIKDILNLLRKDETKKIFCDLFDSKIKYKLIKYKIKKKASNDDDLNELKRIYKVFYKNGFQFHAVKILLLNAFYFYNKMKDKKNLKYDQKKYISFINFAYLICTIDKYSDYVQKKANEKYELSLCIKINNERHEELKNSISEIFKEFDTKFSYDDRVYFWYEKRNNN